jgi:hypothetical protein
LVHAKKDFIVGIVLAAKTGVVLVCILVEAFDGFQAAYRRRKNDLLAKFAGGGTEIPHGAVEAEQVVNEWYAGSR